jgi:hypothetical protein
MSDERLISALMRRKKREDFSRSHAVRRGLTYYCIDSSLWPKDQVVHDDPACAMKIMYGRPV